MYVAYTLFSQFVMQTVLEHDLELLAICCLTLAWKIRDKRFKIHKFKVNLHSNMFSYP